VDNVFRRVWKAIRQGGGTSAQKGGRYGQRMYANARPSRLAFGFGGTTSANSELHASLRNLRDRSRSLIRDSAYAKRAKRVVVENVVGTGVGMQPTVKNSRGDLRKGVNQAIYDSFWDWCRPQWCHTGGQLHFCDLERQIMGQVFEAGEVLVRMHFRSFGGSPVPLALELIEPERLADQFTHAGNVPSDARIIDGIEVDEFYKPVAYWINTVHPGEYLFIKGQVERVERVPADQIIHLRIIDRWPQVRGEPWMHAVIRKLADIDGYTEAEIVAARSAAMYFGTIETDEDTSMLGEEQEDGTYQLPLEPGMVEKLKPGEKLNFVNPNRPNSALDPFLRYMLREMAAGVGVSYESLSRDYSQSNYSSSRLSLLEDRDSWRAIQQWLIRNFREPLHRVWVRQAALSGAIKGLTPMDYGLEIDRFAAAEFKPRGWSWVDPTKEVKAYKEAIMAGLTTVTTVIAQTDPQGRDASEVFEERKRELDELKALGLSFDTSPENYKEPDSESQEIEAEVDAEEPESRNLRAVPSLLDENNRKVIAALKR
jgi:lambda family phage portal protein